MPRPQSIPLPQRTLRNDIWFVSAIPLGELKAGVLASADPRVSSRRLDTWASVARDVLVV